jgi:hypothetical protein
MADKSRGTKEDEPVTTDTTKTRAKELHRYLIAHFADLHVSSLTERDCADAITNIDATQREVERARTALQHIATNVGFGEIRIERHRSDSSAPVASEEWHAIAYGGRESISSYGCCYAEAAEGLHAKLLEEAKITTHELSSRIRQIEDATETSRELFAELTSYFSDDTVDSLATELGTIAGRKTEDNESAVLNIKGWLEETIRSPTVKYAGSGDRVSVSTEPDGSRWTWPPNWPHARLRSLIERERSNRITAESPANK